MGLFDFIKKVTGFQAYQDSNKAKALQENAEARYEEVRRETNRRRKILNDKLGRLAHIRLSSVKELLGTFIALLKDMQQKNKDKQYDFLESIDIKTEKLQEMEQLQMSASTMLKTTVLSGLAGGAALTGVPVAVTSAVGALAAASTGTAIAELSGVAATNATLAWLGGGTLVAGGGGVVAGTAVLTAITGAATGIAAIAMAGLIASAHFSKKLTAAKAYASQVGKAVAQMQRAWVVMDGIGERVQELGELTGKIRERTLTELRYLVPLAADFDTQDEYQIETFQRCGLLARAVGDLARIPIIDENGEMASGFRVQTGKVRKLIVSQYGCQE